MTKLELKKNWVTSCVRFGLGPMKTVMKTNAKLLTGAMLMATIMNTFALPIITTQPHQPIG